MLPMHITSASAARPSGARGRTLTALLTAALSLAAASPMAAVAAGHHHKPAHHHVVRHRSRRTRRASNERARLSSAAVKQSASVLAPKPISVAKQLVGATTKPASPPAKSATSSQATTPAAQSTQGVGGLDKTVCAYTADSIAQLAAFDAMVGRNISCAMVYNYGAPDWSNWADPWFITGSYADNQMNTWATTPGANRRLIISNSLIPNSATGTDWLQQGASGAYEGYARQLAQNLVAAGLGNSVIRLGFEANGDWNIDSLPNTPSGDAQWVQFWRNTVIAMRSVPGAHFVFDWCVNSGYRNIPLASFYPGDDVVDVIGDDVYDTAVTGTPSQRWQALYNEPDGLGAVAAFAAAHHKPMSIPEWGIGPASDTADKYDGDDPTYVNGIASVVANDNVAYQSYFYQAQEGVQLDNSPQSQAAYRAHFGVNGDAVAPSDHLAQTLPTDPAPGLALTGGPSDGAAIGGSVTFTFSAQSGSTALCSLDGAPFTTCTGATSDTRSGLAPGFHFWRVEAFDANHYVRIRGRSFSVS